MRTIWIVIFMLSVGVVVAQEEEGADTEEQAPQDPAPTEEPKEAPEEPAAEATEEPARKTEESNRTRSDDKYGTPRQVGDPVLSTTPPGTSGGAKPGLPQGDIGEGVYLNATEIDIKELIKQFSKSAGKNFLLDDKIRGKVTIISESKMTLDEAYQAFLSALSVAGYTTVEGPGNLLKVVPRKEAIQYPIQIFKGESPLTDNYITRVITLNNISALELSNVVKGLISKDGNMFAYPATNTLIITDTGSNIDRLMQIIKELDKEGPQQIIQIIPIRYATAKDVTDKLNQLFDSEAGKGKTTAAPRRRRGETATDQEDIPAISKIITDDRTNSIIVLGSKRAIADLMEVIAKLDTPLEGAEGTIHVHYLQNAVATEIASVLASLTSGAATKAARSAAATAKDKEAKEGGAAAPTAEFEGGLKVTADENTNSLVIVASPKDYQTLVDKVISKLDIPRRQVYLEAIIMELSSNKTSEFSLSGLGGTSFTAGGQDLLGFASLFGGAGTFSDLATNIGPLGGLAGGLVSQNTVTVPIASESGTSSISVPALGILLHAIQRNENANVLSTPSLLTLDNEEAEIFVGSNIPFQSGNTVNATGTTTTVTREDVGIGLKITPQINESDTVRLKITQEVDNVAVASLQDPSGPTTFKRSVNTVVVADNQQTIVIGGLLQDNSSLSISKVPLFGDIPLVGNLFKSRNKLRQKNNIIVFITPYIIRDRSDFMVILKRKLEERNNFIDYNYGRRQARLIREDIKRHAAHLLEYKEGQMSPYAKPPLAAPPEAPIEREVISSKDSSPFKHYPPSPPPVQEDSTAPTSDGSSWNGSTAK